MEQLEKLEKKRDKILESIHKEALKHHAFIQNLGWGAGMRLKKVTPSFRRDDELKARLEIVEAQILAITNL